MASKGRLPPLAMRYPLQDPPLLQPDPFSLGIRHAPGPFPPRDPFPPPDAMEQKLAAQVVEMQKLATENQRLAATHGTLRKELAAAQHELQLLQSQIGVVETEREQKIMGLVNDISKMESELKSKEHVKMELQQARANAEGLILTRQELVSKVHKLNQDLHRAHADAQQIPALMSELDYLRQEYQKCRVSYDYEKKMFTDHLESLQSMEANYIKMATEMEKLRAELSNASNIDMRSGGAYNEVAVNAESDMSRHAMGQTMYEDGYGAPQGQGRAAISANTGASGGTGVAQGAQYMGQQPGSGVANPGYDMPRGSVYDTARQQGYDAQRMHGYDAQRGAAYDPRGNPAYDTQRHPGYDAQRGSGYDMQHGANYESAHGGNYSGPGAAGQAQQMNQMPYGMKHH